MKGAENMLKCVDEIQNFAMDSLLEPLFSAILTKRHLQLAAVNYVRGWSF